MNENEAQRGIQNKKELVLGHLYILNRNVARMAEKRNAYRILVGNTEGKRPLGRPTRRWVDNIKIDLRDIGWDGIDGSIWFRIGTSGGLW
jgi:hypothetical protein